MIVEMQKDAKWMHDDQELKIQTAITNQTHVNNTRNLFNSQTSAQYGLSAPSTGGACTMTEGIGYITRVFTFGVPAQAPILMHRYLRTKT